MWANAQRDVHPAEYRWRSLRKFRNSIPCTNVNSARGKIPLGCKSPQKCIRVAAQETAKTSCKVWLASGEQRCCSHEAMTRNPLKFAGVPQTPEPISAVSRLKFAILWRHVGEVLLFAVTSFFQLSIHALVAKIQPDKRVWWCSDGEFLAIFCILYFQRATCSTFQTCILNLH